MINTEPHKRIIRTFFLILIFVLSVINTSAQCPVTADFTVNDTTNCTTVSFTNTSTVSSDSIVSYYWDFGDGQSSMLQNPSNTYADPHPSTDILYPVKLVITHSTGCKDSITRNVTIYQVPVADFTATFDSCRQVSFTNNTQNNPDFTYLWDFGDGNSSTLQSPGNHTYNPVATSTNYTITLTVENTNGCVSIATENITILPNITSSFSFSPNNSCSPVLVSFDASSSVSALDYEWNFGDGSGTHNTTSSSISNTFTASTNAACNPGEDFNVNLSVTNDNLCSALSSDVVTVLPRPLPRLEDTDIYFPFSNCGNAPSPSNPNYSLEVANITPNPSCVDYYSIDWGDGITDTLSDSDFPFTHTYTSLGVFYLEITAVGENGCDNDTIYEVANQSNPSINFGNPGGSQGCTPITINFPVSSMQDNSPGTQYIFAWGDGTTTTKDQFWADTATIIPHTYTQTSCPGGALTASCTVINLCDTTIETTYPINIYQGTVAGITSSDSIICLDQQLCLTNNTIIGYGPNCIQHTAFLWDFGDGNTSSAENPCNTYTTPGEYNIVLENSDYCGSSSDSITVLVLGTHAEFDFDTACAGEPIHFTDLSYSYSDSTYNPDPAYPITSWTWTFGDGQTADIPNPSHTYSSVGYFEVSLTVSYGYGCDSTCIDTVYVDDIQIDSVAITPVECYNTNTGAINVYTSLGIGQHTYTIYPGPTTNTTGLFENLNSGNYTIQIIDEHGCQLDTTIVLQNPEGISITSFSSTDITCHDYDDGAITVLGAGGTPPLSYNLQPNDITNSTGTFTGLDSGTYTVVITDIYNCAASITPDIVILNPDSIIIDSSQFEDITCHNLNDGMISVYSSGGTGTLTYTLLPNNISDTLGIFNGLGQDTYTVSVTDENNCPAVISDTIIIINPDGIQIDSVTHTNITCHNLDDGTVTIYASGGTTPYIYSLNPGGYIGSTNTFSSLSPDNYTAQVDDINLCPPDTEPVTILNPEEITIDSIISSNVSCHGYNNGEIIVYANGGTGQKTYTLNPGNLSNTSGQFVGLSGGTYSVSVTDENFCPPASQNNISIVDPEEIVIDSIILTDVSCHNAGDGSIVVTASGGTGIKTFTLNPGSITNNTGVFNNLSGNVYNVSVTDENNCPSEDSTGLVIINPDGIEITSASFTEISCYNSMNGTITIAANGGTGVITYTLQPIGTSNNTGVFDNLGPNTYTVQLSDDNSCNYTTDPITLNNPDLIDIQSEQAIDILCHDDNNGIIDVDALGGTGDLTYTLWPDGSVSQVNNGEFTGLSANTYYVTVTDTNSCPEDTSATFTIVNPDLLVVDSTDFTNITCQDEDDGTITTYISGGTAGTFVYTLTPGGDNNNTGFFDNLVADTYTVTVEDTNGCIAVSNSITITNPPGFTITSLDSTNVSCNGLSNGSISINAIGGTGTINYTLNPGSIPSLTGSFTGLSGGKYTISISDNNVCELTTDTITIIDPDVISIQIEDFTNITCNDENDGVIDVTAIGGTGNLTYTLWPDGTSSQTNNGEFTNLSENSYFVVITDENGCPEDTSNIYNIVNPLVLVIDNQTSTNSTCYDCDNGTISVDASGGTGLLTYTLLPLGTSNNTGEFSGLSPGNYTVTVIDEHGCIVSSNEFIISEPEMFLIITETSTNLTCHNSNDGTVIVTVSGGVSPYTYTLNQTGASQDSGVFINLSPDIYTVTVIDFNGNTITSSDLPVVNPDEITIQSAQGTDITCYNLNDGIIEVQATGGTGNLTYTLWPDGSISKINDGEFTGLSEDTYHVKVVDENLCPEATSQDIIIINPAELIIDTILPTDVTCNNANDGIIQVIVSGGTGDYSYILLPSGTNSPTGLFTGLSGGVYSLQINDSNSCQVISGNIEITDPTPINVIVNPQNISCNGNGDGVIEITANGGTGSLTYSVDNGLNYQSSALFFNLVPNTYNVIVKDSNNCLSIPQAIIITEPDILEIQSFTIITPTCYGCTNGQATAIVVGGTAPYSHSWSNGMTGNPISNLGVGTYTDTVTDFNGCITINSFFMTEPEPLVLTTDSLNIACYGDNTGWISAFATGGTLPYTYEWRQLPSNTVISTNDTLLNATAGSYSVTLYDFYNNMEYKEVTITQPDELVLSFSNSDSVCYDEYTGWAKVVAAGGVLPYTYLWDDPVSTIDSIYGLPAGIYTTTITDANLCESIGSIEIFENPQIFLDAQASENIICSGTSTQLSLNVSGGTQPYIQYNWFPSSTLSNPAIANPIATPQFTTKYYIEITDVRGCTQIDSITIQVNPRPTASYNFNNPCESNIVWFYDASLSNGDSIISWNWSFDDGSTSTTRNPIHYYDNAINIYNVSLAVQNLNGCTDDTIRPVTVNPVIGLDFTAEHACSDDITHFYASTQTYVPIVKWVWDFGDGSSDSIQNPNHYYSLPGTYNVSLIATDQNGCIEYISHQTTIYTNPDAIFKITQTSLYNCGNGEFLFDDQSTNQSGNIERWVWSYNDGSPNDTIYAPNNPDVTHYFDHHGHFNVVLTVLGEGGCVSTDSSLIVITNADFTPSFTYEHLVCDTVQFTDTTIPSDGYNSVMWIWDFGDGDSSDLQNPIHVFPQNFVPGGVTFDVTLIVVVDSMGYLCAKSTMQTITIPPNPDIFWTFTPDPTCFGDTTYFYGESGFPIEIWHWDFGDGNFSLDQYTNHIFSDTGTYDVNLTITDSIGCINSLMKNVEVNLPPQVSISLSDSILCPNTPLYLFGIGDSTVVEYYWDFGDGSFSNEQNPVHFYQTNGTYIITLIGTKTDGCFTTVTEEIIILPSPTADYTYTEIDCATILFSDLSIPPPGYNVVAWNWNFDDGTYSVLQNPVHYFTSNMGIYNVTLVVTSDSSGYSCTDTITQPVYAQILPSVFFTWNPNPTIFGEATNFYGTSGNNIVSWYYDFGDGNFAITQNPVHTYTEPGLYIVNLAVIDDNGCSNSVTHEVNVLEQPEVDFHWNYSCVETESQFYIDSPPTDIPSIEFWEWDFGDGGNSSLMEPTHTYNTVGEYTVSLTITDTMGAYNTLQKIITVNPLPNALFDINGNICELNDVEFVDFSTTQTGFITEWYWNFGDGEDTIVSFPGLQAIYHTYTETGYYTVELTITNSDSCSDTYSSYIYVEPSPIASFTWNGECINTPISFMDGTAENGGGVLGSWHWDFDDPGSGASATSSLQNPIHIFEQSGDYNVSLIVSSIFGCYSEATNVVTITDEPDLNFTWDGECFDAQTFFEVDESITNTSEIVSYYWSFGDGSTSTLQNPVHQYIYTGQYIVTLYITTNNDCNASIQKVVEINPLPVTNFVFSSPTCLNNPVEFTDLTISQNGMIETWIWNFGDGTEVTIIAPDNPNITHLFANNGTYNVSLTAIDVIGCEFELIKPLEVVSSPNAEFIFEETCYNTPVLFTDLSSPAGGTDIYAWQWYFGDPASGTQNTSNLPNPSHIYSAPGTYTATMIVINASGCSDTISHDIEVEPLPAVSIAVIEDSVCLGQLTEFSGSGTGIATWFWEFGDGGTSIDQNPNYLYSSPGIYIVTLTVTGIGADNCENSVSMEIVVNGPPSASFTYLNSCVDDSTYFYDNSSTQYGIIIEWYWDFGDGQSSTLQNPTHVYSTIADYEITLISFDNTGCSDTVSQIIHISSRPVPSFSFNQICEPEGKVDFFDESDEGIEGSPIIGWEWYFHDGTYSTEIDPSFLYENLDTCYTVYLKITDDNGCSATDTNNNVCLHGTLDIDFISNIVCLNQPTMFEASYLPENDSVIEYQWNFNDGSGILTTTYDTISHVFNSYGPHYVELTAVDTNNCSKSIYHLVVIDSLPTPNFTHSIADCDLPVTFLDQSQSNADKITTWYWDFGDIASGLENNSILENPEHLYYLNDSTYQVKLIVTNTNNCVDSVVKDVFVEPCITANFGLDTMLCARYVVYITDSSSMFSNNGNINHWYWDFGDGTNLDYDSYRDSIEHTYHDPGSYLIQLVVLSSMETGVYTDTIQMVVNINPTPVAKFDFINSCLGDSSIFVDESVGYGEPISTWYWDFGNTNDPVSISTIPSPKYLYPQFGDYNVSLNVKNVFSCADSISKTVSVYKLPEANFTFRETCKGYFTYFEDESFNDSAEIVKYNWDFGLDDILNDTSNQKNPIYAYHDEGVFSTTLKIFDANGCVDTSVEELEIFPIPRADFNIIDTIRQGNIYLENISSDGIDYYWDFDFNYGYNSTEENPIHQYENDGSYEILLITYNDYGCPDTISKIYEVLFTNLFVPNAFSPSDIHSELRIFKPVGINLMRYKLQIHSSWGGIVYESTKLENGAPKEGWDGRFRGKDLPTGSYVWKIEAMFEDGTIWKGSNNGDGNINTSGTVILIR